MGTLNSSNTKRYFQAFLIIAVLSSIIVINLFNYLKSTNNEYAQIINISGKQRMLSQRLVILAQNFYISKDSKSKHELLEVLKEIELSHEYLLTKVFTPELKFIYFEDGLNKDLKEYISNFYSLIKTNDEIYIKYVRDASGNILEQLDKTVKEYEKYTQEQLELLDKYKSYIVIASLLSIVIFSFLFVRLKEQHSENIILTNELNDKTIQLEKVNKELVLFNKNLAQKVKEEVDKNREKDKHMLQQSRLAQMGEMISMIAHQWRQPLGAIGSTVIGMKLQLSNAKNKLESEDDREIFLKSIDTKYDTISEYVQFLSTTISDFRNFFKPNKIQESTSLITPIERALHIVQPSVEHHNIKMVLDFQEEESILMYQNEIMQVILNILKNAEDNFIEKQTKEPTINIKTFKKDKSYVISILDNGGGIDEEILPKIFDPYFSTKDDKNGTGLGLYMSKVIIEEHNNGLLNVENVDNGVCFSIVFN